MYTALIEKGFESREPNAFLYITKLNQKGIAVDSSD